MERAVATTDDRRRTWVCDPWVAVMAAVVTGLCVWMSVPLATGATGSGSTGVGFLVKSSIAVAPALQRGDSSVRLGDLTGPGQERTVSSDNWVMSTNWSSGYDVLIRSTTDPALRGGNAVDSNGARDAFVDFSTGTSCPCPWTTNGFTRGVFGYSAHVSTRSGPAAVGAGKWGGSGNWKWRGFDDTDYLLYETTGGTGSYDLDLNLRSALPPGAVQTAGSYRASLLLTIRPNV